MKTKPYFAWLIIGVLALAIWLAWPFGHRAPPDKASAPETGTPASSVTSTVPSVATGIATPPPASVASRAPGVVATPGHGPAAGTPAASPNVAEPVAPSQTAQIDVGRVRRMVTDYHTLMGENPVGTNAEIMQLMTGGNTKQATLGPPDGISLNAQGELVDPWGSPYFFHQLSRDKMEVRSAGPDKVMWTADDVIAR